MMHNCDVVQDLLPLYIDDVCSGASANMIRAHLEECPKCREMFRQLGRDAYTQANTPDSEEVLVKASQSFSRRAVYSAMGILAIVVFWVVFFWQDYLADMGNYRYFSYSFHEMYTIGLILVPPAALIWFLVLLHKTRKQKAWKKNGALLLVLLLVVCFHAGYFLNQQGTWSTSGLYEVVEVPDDYHIVIRRGDGLMTLEVSPMVANLVKTDGTAYSMTFVWKERNPGAGVLEYIETTDILWD